MTIRPNALTESVDLIGISSDVDTDRYGNPIPVEAAPITLRASVSPLEATEDDLSRETRVTRYTVLLEPDVDVTGIDKIEWRDTTYEVIGEPKVFTDRSGPHHLELVIRSITG